MKVGAFQYQREFDSPIVAHEIYHRQFEHDQYGLRTGLGVFHSLSESSDPHHQYDAGWQAIDLAEFAHGEDREWLVGAAHALWKNIANSCKNRGERLTSAYVDCFTPVFLAGEDGEYDRRELRDRLATVLGTVAHSYRKTSDGSMLGLANEVATAYLLARLSYKTDGITPIAWPSKSWEDRHHGDEDLSGENFDLHVGQYPFSFTKIQVKSFLDQNLSSSRRTYADGDILLAKWRKLYSPRISLIFGDVHLGCERGDMADLFFKLLDPDKFGGLINIATNNLIEEISSPSVIDLTEHKRPSVHSQALS